MESLSRLLKRGKRSRPENQPYKAAEEEMARWWTVPVLVAAGLATLAAAVPSSTGNQFCLTHQSYDFFGVDFDMVTGVTDPDDCCNFCRASAGCMAWTLVQARKRCWLKFTVPIGHPESHLHYTGIAVPPTISECQSSVSQATLYPREDKYIPYEIERDVNMTIAIS